MKKSILVLMPKNIKEGQPSFERINSFKNFYEQNGIFVLIKEHPTTFIEKINLIQYIYKNKVKNIFISMPPFRNWFVFLLPTINTILDIRDGWSIAMKSGYGGTARPRKLKALVARLYEKLAISKAALTITCTNGLEDYLRKLSSKPVLLITNGYSEHDLETIKSIKLDLNQEERIAFDVGVCAGQFSEYGEEKIKIILSKINKQNKKTVIKLIGSSLEKNNWIYDWLKKEKLFNIELKILPRMNREEMYKEILQSDFGLAVIRDPEYDFGTKVFDYILCKKPIFDYFDEVNHFVTFFKKQMTSAEYKDFNVQFLREDLIDKNKELLLGSLK